VGDSSLNFFGQPILVIFFPFQVAHGRGICSTRTEISLKRIYGIGKPGYIRYNFRESLPHSIDARLGAMSGHIGPHVRKVPHAEELAFIWQGFEISLQGSPPKYASSRMGTNFGRGGYGDYRLAEG
jgi:hypothetical protein